MDIHKNKLWNSKQSKELKFTKKFISLASYLLFFFSSVSFRQTCTEERKKKKKMERIILFLKLTECPNVNILLNLNFFLRRFLQFSFSLGP